MKKIILLLFLLTSGLAQAQDLFKGKIYTTTHLMEVKDDIALTEAQVSKIKKIHSENAGSFSTIKWDLDDATAKLKKMLEQPKIDQTSVSRQMDEVLRLENQLKKMQLSALVSIKNELTSEQITKLEERKVPGVAKATSISGNQVFGTATTSSINRTTEATSSSPKVAVTVNGKGEQPLYYINTKSGMMRVNSFENIDPKVIESVTVLKGEQALLKFGEKGINGVVVIKLINGKDENPLEN
jgi:Spy/CpxP family protein refolding chaperone